MFLKVGTELLGTWHGMRENYRFYFYYDGTKIQFSSEDFSKTKYK